MADDVKSYANKNNVEHDLQNTAGYRKYWTRNPTNCNWTNNCLHWHHCDKETMENMSSTLPHIQKVMISIGNTLADSHTDYEFQNLKTIRNQQKCGGVLDQKRENKEQLKNILEKLAHLGKNHNNYVMQTLLKEFENMFNTLDNISKAIGYET